MQTEALPKQTNSESRQNLNRSKIVHSEEMQAAIMQVAIKAATMTIRAIWESEPPAKPHTRRGIPEEHCRLRQAGPIEHSTIRHLIGMLNCLILKWR